MDFDFNKIKEMGLEYAEKGKNAAKDLAEKGKTQALIVNEQGKLLKAQRQLGALVYSLAKGKEENQPKSPARPARSAVHPSRTMHCSAISAAHSCNVNSAPAKTGKRAVSPLAGYRPVFAKKEKSP